VTTRLQLINIFIIIKENQNNLARDCHKHQTIRYLKYSGSLLRQCSLQRRKLNATISKQHILMTSNRPNFIRPTAVFLQGHNVLLHSNRYCCSQPIHQLSSFDRQTDRQTHTHTHTHSQNRVFYPLNSKFHLNESGLTYL
jgi:hypothetical protein